MSVTIPVTLDRDFSVDCTAEQAYELLADVPRSASYFPDVEELKDMGGGTYEWVMEKVGIGKLSVQTLYASLYTCNPDDKTVSWEPVPDIGNAKVSGYWQIADAGDGHVNLSLHAESEFDLPIPRLAKAVTKPILEREFGKLMDQYVDNLRDTMNTLH